MPPRFARARIASDIARYESARHIPPFARGRVGSSVTGRSPSENRV